MQSWIYALLIAQVPLALADRPTFSEAEESREERALRYESIAEDIAAAAPSRDAAALLVAIAVHESGLARDVDLGPCAPARVRQGGCDRGRAKTLWQLQTPNETSWPSRREAAARALRLAEHSKKRCAHLPRTEQLAAYAAGRCDSAIGRRRSREIMALVRSP